MHRHELLQLVLRLAADKKEPLSNFAAEAALLKGAVLLSTIGQSAQQALEPTPTLN